MRRTSPRHICAAAVVTVAMLALVSGCGSRVPRSTAGGASGSAAGDVGGAVGGIATGTGSAVPVTEDEGNPSDAMTVTGTSGRMGLPGTGKRHFDAPRVPRGTGVSVVVFEIPCDTCGQPFLPIRAFVEVRTPERTVAAEGETRPPGRPFTAALNPGSYAVFARLTPGGGVCASRAISVPAGAERYVQIQLACGF